jgi:PAS domain S-box-containing protein
MTGSGAWSGGTEDLLEVLASAADAITVQDPAGQLVYANMAAALQLGYASPEELVNVPTAEVLADFELLDEGGGAFPFADLPGRRALLGEANPTAVVGFRRRSDPGERWSLVQATPVVRDGRIAFVINVFHDITDLKRTESRLRLLAEAGAALADTVEFETTLGNLAERVVPILADWCVVDVSDESGLRRVAVAHPDPAKRALAEDLERRYPPDPDHSGTAEVMRSGTTLIIPDITDEMLQAAARDAGHLDGLRRLGLASIAVVPLKARQATLGVLTLARAAGREPFSPDDRPFLEDLARRASVAVDSSRLLRAANEAIRLRDDFVAMASHDMRTPLGTILGNVQLARRWLARPDADARERIDGFMESAERTTGKLARLVEELMDATMLRAGNPLPVDETAFDLVELAGATAAEQQRLTDRHRLAIEGATSLPGRWDRRRIERVLDNVLDNAIKYSPGGGDVTIRLGTRDEMAEISVTDEGIGIPSDELTAIFDPYHRASNASGLRGIGLGLGGSRDVVRRLGGDITVESVEGAGSTFTIRLPLGATVSNGG